MASVETFDCSIKFIIWFTLAFDCFIKLTCINLTVLIEYLNFDRLPEASENGLDLPLVGIPRQLVCKT